MDNFTKFIITLEGFSIAQAFHEAFPEKRALPDCENNYLILSPEGEQFRQGAAFYFRTVDMLENGESPCV